MYVYKERDKLFQSLSWEAAVSYIAVLVLLSLLFSHPLYLIMLLFALNAVIISAGIFKEWLGYIRFSLILIFIIVLVNMLFVHAGSTILWRGPRLPFLGVIRITLEALCYGIGMGIRLLLMMGSFCLLNYAVHPDILLKAFGGGRSKIVHALNISLRLFPIIADDFVRITEAQRCRGVDFKASSLKQRIKKYIPVLNTVLLSSLERSFQLAESLQSRGYGIAGRTCYKQVLRRPRDYLVLSLVALGLIYAIILVSTGAAEYIYYPRLQTIKRIEILMAILLALFFIFPALLNWGWQKCPLLRSKI